MSDKHTNSEISKAIQNKMDQIMAKSGLSTDQNALATINFIN